MSRGSEVARLRTELVDRLRSRRDEIEEAVVTRVKAIADPAGAADPAYASGLRSAVTAAIEYGLEALERGQQRASPVPVALLAQARLAARNGVGLDVVLRRYVAGFTLLGDFVLAEAAEVRLPSETLKGVLTAQAALLERVTAEVAEEYGREGAQRPDTTERRRAELVERLLAGEQADPLPLAYEFDVCHVGVTASGSGAADAVRDIAARLDCRLLLLCREEDLVWAWLGAGTKLDGAYDLKASDLPAGTTLALGEPCEGLPGWRLTHRQALAALPIALRRGEPVVFYREVALLAAALSDEFHAESLRQLFIAPLRRDRGDSDQALFTLRAYFAADRNMTSAAARLGVNRNTVAYRLRAIEDAIGQPLGSCAVELELALRLEDLDEQAERS